MVVVFCVFRGGGLAVIDTIDPIRIHLIPCFHKKAALMDDKVCEVINHKKQPV